MRTQIYFSQIKICLWQLKIVTRYQFIMSWTKKTIYQNLGTKNNIFKFQVSNSKTKTVVKPI